MTQLKLIVFDWDGTLSDSEAAIVLAMRDAYTKNGCEPPIHGAVRAIIGLSLDEAIATLTPRLTSDEVTSIALSYRQNYRSQNQAPGLFPGVRDTLATLHEQGYYLAVATGKSRTGLQRALNDNNLGVYFSSTRSAEDTAPKPDPTMVIEIMDELDVPASATMMIGDTSYDLDMARAAGTHLAAVSYGAHPSSQLSLQQPSFILDCFAELTNRLMDF